GSAAAQGSSQIDAQAVPSESGAIGAPSSAATTEASSARTAEPWNAPPALPMAHATAWLVLFGMLFGRALAPALPGARAGFERWITWGDQLGSVLTQAALLVGTLTTVVLLLTTLRQSTLGILYR